MHNILSLRAKRGDIVNQMSALVDLAKAEGRAMTPDEDAKFDALNAEAAGLLKTIERAEEIDRVKAATAQPVSDSGRAAVTQDQSEKYEKGTAITRIVRALAVSKGDVRRASDYARETLRDDAVAKALAAGSAAGGGFIVPDNYSAELIEYLRPASVVRRMGAQVVPMPGGSMTMPKQSGGGSAAYLGENTNIATTEQTFTQLRLTARKLAALTPISNDLIRYSSPSVDAIVRNDLVNAIAQAEDANFIRGDGTGSGPKGLRYWAPSANVITVNATVNLANVDVDLNKLWLALANNNARMINLGWLMAPRTKSYLETVRDGNGNKAFPEIAQMRLKGYPFALTTQIPINLSVTGSNESEIYLVDFNDVIIAEVPGLEIEVSSEAAYHDGSNVVAAFSLDQTVIRVITRHDFGMRYDFSVAVLSDVDWV